MPQIDADRLLGDLYELRRIGEYKTGVHRPALSPEDIRSRQWLVKKLAEAGLTAEIDGIANVYGWDRSDGGKKLLMGSHIETQPHAGWLDGAMGVIFGLEAARALGGGIDVAAWFDEEGWFGGFPGSRSFCGLLPEAEIDTMKRRGDNVPLRAALEQAGWGGRKRIQANPARYLGYLEAHIEQGAELELTGDRIGIVTAIVGSHRFRIAFEGVQNHAGTTRMARRKDAGVALARLAVAINDRFPALVNERTVWTTGQITVEPGSPSIVPGKAEMVFQFRDTDPEILARLGRELTLLVEEARLGPCKVSLITTGTTSPAAMDARFQGAFEASAAKHAPGKFQLMPSGAGHDAQILSTIMPAGMLFVPSIGGISHHYAEDTSDADLVLGCQVFVDAAAALLEG
jgi:N-carbamoyl-L-amino-acid hydrolase